VTHRDLRAYSPIRVGVRLEVLSAPETGLPHAGQLVRVPLQVEDGLYLKE